MAEQTNETMTSLIFDREQKFVSFGFNHVHFNQKWF